MPFPLSVNVTPLGNVPVLLTLEAGKPVVVTVKLPAVPAVKVVLAELPMAGAWSTVSVKLCVAFGLVPLVAVILSE